MSTTEINGTSFETVERGNGQSIVFVHGSNSDYRTWQAQMDELSKSYRAIAYSRRYHWPNAQIPDGADYSMNEHLDDLQAFIHTLDDAPVHLVGHSYGAFISLLLAMREPGLIRSLVLGEAPVITLFISLPPKPQQILALFLRRPRTAAAIVKFAATGLVPATTAAERDDMDKNLEIFGAAVLGKEAFKRLSYQRLEQVKANNFKAEFLGSGFLPVDAEAVKHVQIPTLLLNGENSPALFHHLTQGLQELLPHAEDAEIPAASHLMHEDNPSAYNMAILSFIQRHS